MLVLVRNEVSKDFRKNKGEFKAAGKFRDNFLPLKFSAKRSEKNQIVLASTHFPLLKCTKNNDVEKHYKAIPSV